MTLPLIGGIIYYTTFRPDFQIYALVSLLSILYKPVLEGAYGATVGKMAVKIKVVGEGGRPITWAQALMRATPWIFAALVAIYLTYGMFQIPGYADAEGFTEVGKVMYKYQIEQAPPALTNWLQRLIGWLPLVSALFIFGNRANQAAHDLLAETYVVHTNTTPMY